MGKKYPNKIPWSMIDTDALRQSMRQMEIDKQSTLTGIAQTEMQQANANRQANQEMFMEGLGTVANAAIGMPYKGGVGKPKKKL